LIENLPKARIPTPVIRKSKIGMVEEIEKVTRLRSSCIECEAACPSSPSISGSEREFVEARILGGFLKNDEFGLGNCHALGLEQQVAEILVAAAPSQ
jgi:hypothetical protein